MGAMALDWQVVLQGASLPGGLLALTAIRREYGPANRAIVQSV